MAKRCDMCGGKFGLSRHELSRKQFCRRQCLEEYKSLLSAREREVIVLLAEGLTNAAIAKRLSLSDHTVKRHVANILVKLDLPTRAAAGRSMSTY